MMRLVLDTLLGEVLASSWILASVRSQDRSLLSQIVERKSSALHKQARNFVLALGVLFPSLQPCEQQYILDRVHVFAEEFDQGWRTVDVENAAEVVGKELLSFLQLIFICLCLFFIAVHTTLSSAQCVRALQTISLVQIGRVPVTLYDQIFQKLALKAATSKEDLKSLVELFSASAPKDGDLSTLSRHQLLAVRFFMAAMLPVMPLIPDDLLNEHLLPVMFKNVAHRDVKVSRAVHQMFKSLFLDPWGQQENAMQSHVEKLVPYYINVCLDHYASIPFEPFADNIVAIVLALPPTSPLVVLTLKILADRVQKMQSETASAPSSKAADPRRLIRLLFSFMAIVDVQILDVVLVLIRNTIKSSPQGAWPQLTKYAQQIILNNFDYTRKDQCIKWYLGLLHDLQLGKKVDKEPTTTSAIRSSL